TAGGHPFYEALNRVLKKSRFDRFVEDRCQRFYARKMGRPGVPPGVYKEAERKAVHANRRRIRAKRGKELLRRRGELLELPFAHALETGGMRRTHLRYHDNILERLLIHVAGVNSSLLMRTLVGVGKPRCLQGRPDLAALVFRALLRLWLSLVEHWARTWEILAGIASNAGTPRDCDSPYTTRPVSVDGPSFTTGC